MDYVNMASNVLTAVGGAAVLAALLPRPAAGSKLETGFKVLDLLAANWLNARNQAKP